MAFSKKYRLRKQNLIVGYAKETPDGILFQGKGLLWFMQKNISYDAIDEFVGMQDSMKRDIYELDIVKYKINKSRGECEGIILWETTSKSFVILDTNTQHCTPIFIDDICIFQNDVMEVVSHLFNHPSLIKKLGLKVD